MEKTTDYEMFKLRSDNRENGVIRTHVEKLKASIQKHNLLHMRPISVNAEYEIIDGQHRFTAAKELGVPIYYEVNKELKDEDIILMNVSRSWNSGDYFNYYVKHKYPEYLKLEKFMKESGLTLTIAIRLLNGGAQQPRTNFREGKFVFHADIANSNYDLCWQTIQTLERLLGCKQWMKSSKLWQAFIMIFNHPNFNEKKWFHNLEMLIGKVTQKVSTIDYFNLFREIHNFRNQVRIEDVAVLESGE